MSCDYSGLASSLDLDAQGSFQVTFNPTAVKDLSRPENITSNMYVSTTNTLDPWIPPLNPISIQSSLASMVDGSLWFDTSNIRHSESTWHFENDQLEVLSRFRERTSLTMGTTHMAPLYRDFVCQLACKVGLSHCARILQLY